MWWWWWWQRSFAACESYCSFARDCDLTHLCGLSGDLTDLVLEMVHLGIEQHLQAYRHCNGMYAACWVVRQHVFIGCGVSVTEIVHTSYVLLAPCGKVICWNKAHCM